MANVIANNMDRFRQDFRYLEHKISSLQELHRKVFEEINALTGMWEGAAHDIYLAQFLKDSENMKLVLENLLAYQNSLEEAYQKFQTCEQQVNDVVNRVQI